MTTVKNFLQKHKFFLFFFCVIAVYNFTVTSNFSLWKISRLSYAFHAMDFSVGFCTRILPGAIYNFLFDDINARSLTVYLSVITLICFVFISYLLERVLLAVKEVQRGAVFILAMFFITGTFTFSIYADGLGWFDFYWLFATVLFFFCLSKKALYPLIIPIFLFEVMVYYTVILSYLPMMVIIMLYKISCTQEKKERRFLWVVLSVAFMSSIFLFVYMILFETYNVNYSFEEFKTIMESRGVEQFEYYCYAFYRDEMYSLNHYEEYLGNVDSELIINMPSDATPIVAFFIRIIQQIQSHLQISSHEILFPSSILLLPVLILIIKTYLYQIKISKGNKLKQFTQVSSIALFFVTLIFGLLFSTDTIRWLTLSFTPICMTLFYVIYKEGEELRDYLSAQVFKIPLKYIVPYFILYILKRPFFA